MQRGRGVIVVLALLAIAAAAAWYWFRPELTELTASGPEITPIPAIVAAPARFDGKQVTVKGVVTSTSDIRLSSGAGSRSYTLKEGNAELVVVPRDALPPRGHTLTVTGTVVPPPRGQGLAPRLTEQKRELGAKR